MSKICLTPYEKLIKKIDSIESLPDPSVEYRKLIFKLFKDQKKDDLTIEELIDIFNKLTGESFQGVDAAYRSLAKLNLDYLNSDKELSPITSIYLDVLDYRDKSSETYTNPDKLVKRLFSFKTLDIYWEQIVEAFDYSGLNKDKPVPKKDDLFVQKATFLLSQCYESLSKHHTLHPKIKLCLNQILRNK